MGALFGPEQMDDDVARVDQYPLAALQAFDRPMPIAGGTQRVEHALGQRHDLALRVPAGDDHVIGEGGFVFEVDDRDFFGFAVVQGGFDQAQQGVMAGGAAPLLDLHRFATRYGGHLECVDGFGWRSAGRASTTGKSTPAVWRRGAAAPRWRANGDGQSDGRAARPKPLDNT